MDENIFPIMLYLIDLCIMHKRHIHDSDYWHIMTETSN